jgi:BolA family transcriptional regulator, general stress-responsive regulator
MSAPTAVETAIRQHLAVALEPVRLDVINESHLHAGHRSSPGTGDSHFRLVIVSPKFIGLGRVARQRLVNQALASLRPWHRAKRRAAKRFSTTIAGANASKSGAFCGRSQCAALWSPWRGPQPV